MLYMLSGGDWGLSGLVTDLEEAWRVVDLARRWYYVPFPAQAPSFIGILDPALVHLARLVGQMQRDATEEVVA